MIGATRRPCNLSSMGCGGSTAASNSTKPTTQQESEVNASKGKESARVGDFSEPGSGRKGDGTARSEKTSHNASAYNGVDGYDGGRAPGTQTTATRFGPAYVIATPRALTNREPVLPESVTVRLRKLKAAEEQLDIAKASADSADSPADVIATQTKVAELSAEVGDKRTALKAFSIALAAARESGDTAAEASTLMKLAKVNASADNHVAALNCYKDLMRATDDEDVKLSCLREMGACSLALGDYSSAVNSLASALEVLEGSESVDDPRTQHMIGAVYGTMGVAYAKQGKKETAGKCLAKEYAIANELGDREALGRASLNLSTFHSLAECPLTGLAFAETAVECAVTQGAVALEMDARLGLGKLYEELGLHEKAQEEFATVLDCHVGTMALDTKEKLQANLGSAALGSRDFATAIHFCRQQLETALKTKNRVRMIQAYKDFGIALARSGEVAAAIRQLEKGLKCAQKLGDIDSEVYLSVELGALLLRDGNVLDAADMLEHAASIVVDPLGRTSVDLALAAALLDMGDLAGAQEAYQETKTIAIQGGSPAVETAGYVGLCVVGIVEGYDMSQAVGDAVEALALSAGDGPKGFWVGSPSDRSLETVSFAFSNGIATARRVRETLESLPADAPIEQRALLRVQLARALLAADAYKPAEKELTESLEELKGLKSEATGSAESVSHSVRELRAQAVAALAAVHLARSRSIPAEVGFKSVLERSSPDDSTVVVWCDARVGIVESHIQLGKHIAVDDGLPEIVLDRGAHAVAYAANGRALLAQGNHQAAVSEFEKSVEAATAAGDSLAVASALCGLGVAEAALGRPSVGFACATLVAATVLHLARAAYTSRAWSLFSAAVWTTVAGNAVLSALDATTPAEAFLVAERLRSVVHRPSRGLSDQAMRIPAFASVATATRTASKANTTVVLYSIVRCDRVAAWVISQAGAVNYLDLRFGDGDELASALAAVAPFMTGAAGLRSALAVRSLTDDNCTFNSHFYTPVAHTTRLQAMDVTDALKLLYRVLIRPVLDAVPAASSNLTTFIPDFALASIPFAALTNENGQCLGDLRHIAVCPSLKHLARITQLRISRRNSHDYSAHPAVLSTTKGDELDGLLSELDLERNAVVSRASPCRRVFAGAPGSEPTESEAVTRGVVVVDMPVAEYAPAKDSVGEPALAWQFQDAKLSIAELLAPGVNANVVAFSGRSVLAVPPTHPLYVDGVWEIVLAALDGGAEAVLVPSWSVPADVYGPVLERFVARLTSEEDGAATRPAFAARAALRDLQETYIPPASGPPPWAAFTVYGMGA